MSDTPEVRPPALPKQKWDIYLAAGLLAVVSWTAVVEYAVTVVGELMGGLAAEFGLEFTGLLMMGLFLGASARARSWVVALPALALPVLAYGWMRLAFRLPGTVHNLQHLNPLGDPVGDYYSELGGPGNAIIAGSTLAVLVLCWVLGDRRFRWFVQTPAVVAVVMGHLWLILWLMGRPTAW